jgi:hypothetical protein
MVGGLGSFFNSSSMSSKAFFAARGSRSVRMVTVSPDFSSATSTSAGIAKPFGKRTATLLPDLNVLVWTGLFIGCIYGIYGEVARGAAMRKPVLSQSKGADAGVWQRLDPSGGFHRGAADGRRVVGSLRIHADGDSVAECD